MQIFFSRLVSSLSTKTNIYFWLMEEVGELFSSVFESVCWYALPACVRGVRALSLCINVCGCVCVCVRGRRVVKVER